MSDTFSFSDFQKLDLRVGKVVSAAGKEVVLIEVDSKVSAGSPIL